MFHFSNMTPFHVFEELACSDTFYAEGGDLGKERKLQRGGNEVAFHQELVAQLTAAERCLEDAWTNHQHKIMLVEDGSC